MSKTMNSSNERNKEPQFFDASSKTRIPSEERRNVLITSALPYVNNVPHLGNIIGSVLSADVFSRYCHIRGYQSLYICGTDEYGTATEMKALSEGVSPREICDRFYGLHKQIYEWFNIDFDHFGRTTTSHQTEIAQSIFLKIFNNGYTSTDTQKQLRCGVCDKFLADRFVNGICPHCSFNDARGDQCDGCGRLLDSIELIEPRCLICGSKPTLEESKHVFLDLDRLSSQLQAYIDQTMESCESRWSNSAITITKSWLKMGLERRCITRDLQWGTPVPLEEFSSKVFYVWFDAPIGYISITKSLLGDDWTKWWKNPRQVELFHFLGKDNVAFHSIIFPATLIATKDSFTRARHICATEYLNYEDQKFSKSRGVGIFGDAVSKIGIPADVLRFYLLYMRPESHDTSFCWDDFMLKVNSELLANLGNFVLRALTFLSNFFGGVQPPLEATAAEEELFVSVDKDLEEYTRAMEEVRMRDALQHILSISRKGNQYMQTGQPWVLVKGSPEDKARAGTIIGASANLCALLSILLYPFMPRISAQIQEQCNLPNNIMLPDRFMLYLKTGHKHSKPFALFTKLESAKLTEWKSLFGGKQQQSVASANGLPGKKAPTKGKKKEEGGEEGSKRAAVKATIVRRNMVDDGQQQQSVDGLYGEVLAKFQKAKEVYVAKEIAKLDREIGDLRAQIEQCKQKLGYSGTLFSPSPSPSAPRADAEEEKEAAVIVGQKNVKSVVNDKKSKQQLPLDSVKGQQQKGQETDGGRDSAVDVGRLDLRVGRIIEVHKHPDADSLYVEQIDLAEEKPRTVVSGLVKFVSLDQMKNRLVVCLCNLKPAKMRGVESQAMVMCASTPDKVEILEVESSCEPGDIIVCDTFVHRPDPILNPKKKIWEAIAPDLSVAETGECVYKGHVLRVQRVECALTAPTLRNVPVK